VGAVVGRLQQAAGREGRSSPQASAPSGGPRATPAARRLAKELGVRLEDIHPVGERIHEADVRAAQATLGTTRLSGRRAVIAERMVASLREMAQLTITMEVDVTAAAALRDQLAQLWQHRPTYTDLVLAAAARALREHPALNATFEHGALQQHARIDIGLAVDAPEGLIVPVIRHVDQLDLADLVAESRRLADQARANTLALDDLHGGTFSVTSLGALGVDFFTPIVNPPQVAILGIGRASPKLALVNGSVHERQALCLSLSFDHRAVDGAPAARFLNRVKALLELPAGLLTAQGMKLPPLTSSTAPTQ
jgi:pyruvate dehydrogenase E2 component (dihydrolipoamide acetyltransferase)